MGDSGLLRGWSITLDCFLAETETVAKSLSSEWFGMKDL